MIVNNLPDIVLPVEYEGNSGLGRQARYGSGSLNSVCERDVLLCEPALKARLQPMVHPVRAVFFIPESTPAISEK